MGTRYTESDAASIVELGRKALKKPNPVFLVQSPEEFEVQTNEGLLTGKPGDFIAHDPISGHVWPVASSYVKQHYDFVEYGEDQGLFQ